MLLNRLFKNVRNQSREDLLQFIIQYFSTNTDLDNSDFFQEENCIKLQNELLKIGFEVMLKNNKSINGEGCCLINVSQNKEEKNWLFCKYNTKLDFVRYYDIKKNNSYFSSIIVMNQIAINELCLDLKQKL